MNKTGLWIRTGIIVAITLIGIYLVFGPRDHALSATDFTADGIKNNLSKNINLGLDLKGGSHLVMRVKTEEYLKNLTENNRDAALVAAKEAKDENGAPLTAAADVSSVTENNNYQISLTVADASKNAAIVDAVKKKVPDFANWTENENGNVITWSLPVQVQTRLKEQATDQAMKIIDSRINAFGVKEPTLQKQGRSDSGQILLQMPGVENPERVKNLVGETSHLSLMKIVSPPNPTPVQTYPSEQAALQSVGGSLPPNRKIYPFTERDQTPPNANGQNPQDKPKQFVIVETPAVVDGSDLRDANAVSRTGSNADYQISFSFKPAGAQKFGDWTGKNIGNYMAVVLNNEVKSAAYIKSQIFDAGEISGRFTKTTADDLALTLKSGALPASIEYQEERTVGPSLGADSIRSGVAASIGGLVLVVLFMLFYYRGSGINAVIALVLNMLLTMAALVVFKSTLTLPGIAGLILGIGMAVDSNVLIFERIREELRLGFDVPKSIELGFDRAFITIIDTHITTIISSVILYMYGSGPIKGFAVTLILGLLINLFSAVFVSRTIFMWLLSRKQKMERLSI
ncbi:MAG: protein translocase subunit SecD [Acidobacteriota bacterium]|nr:protein translocase subunit SecD [Acidobacteriota bacterium]